MAKMSKYYGGHELTGEQLGNLRSGKGVYVAGCKNSAKDKKHGEIIYHDENTQSVKTAKGYEYVPYSVAAVYEAGQNQYSDGQTFDMQDGYIQQVTQSRDNMYMYTDVRKTKTPVFQTINDSDRKAVDRAGERIMNLTDSKQIDARESGCNINIHVIQGKNEAGEKAAKNGRNRIVSNFSHDTADDWQKYYADYAECEELSKASRSEIIQPYPDYMQSKIEKHITDNDRQSGIETIDKLEKHIRGISEHVNRANISYESSETASDYTDANISKRMSDLKQRFDNIDKSDKSVEKHTVDMCFTHGNDYKHDYIEHERSSEDLFEERFGSKKSAKFRRANTIIQADSKNQVDGQMTLPGF